MIYVPVKIHELVIVKSNQIVLLPNRKPYYK